MNLSQQHNPDVLSCLANLSSEEVFTPPKLANELLDLLPVQLWSDKNTRFLDPMCKSGVFLREMAKRLMNGLQKDFPDLQERINHIFTKQLFGIAITELTSFLSRRSIYCSKTANGKYSICNKFQDSQGNIFFLSSHTHGKMAFVFIVESERRDTSERKEARRMPTILFTHMNIRVLVVCNLTLSSEILPIS